MSGADPARRTGRVIFTRAGARRGALTSLPLLIGMVPFGLVIGVLSAAKGLSFAETVLMSGLVFAGAAQLVVLELWTDPAPILAATVATLVVNIRMAPMGAALAPWLDRLRGWKLWGTLATMVDHSFALAIAEQRAGGRDAGFLLGVGLCIWVGWVGTVAAGHLGGGLVRVPPGHPLFFAAIAAFLSILVPLWRGPRLDLLPWLVAALVAIAAHRAGLPVPLPLLAGTFAGAGLGAWIEMRGRGIRRAGRQRPPTMGEAMLLRADVLLAILGMALATYASRAGGYAVLRAVRPPPWVQVMLRHLPGCLFAAYVAPPLLAGSWPAWIGALVVVGVQVASRNMGAAIIAGIATTWGLRLLAG